MPKSDKRQTSFDYSMRGHRLRLLNRIVLPTMASTSPAAMTAVLAALDDHARDDPTCRLRVATIAQDKKLGERSIYRALAALESLGLLERTYTGRSSRYRIIWSRVADFDPKTDEENVSTVADQGCHHGRPALPPWQTRTDTVADQPCHDGRPTEAPLEAQQEPPPPNVWEEAEAAVAAVPGILKPRTAIAAARGAGVGPAYVVACVRFWRSTGGALEVGALVDRLRESHPSRDPADPLTWHPPRPPSAREGRALDVLARVRDWCHEHGQSDVEQILSTFDAAATSDQYGPFTPQEIQRARFDAARKPEFFKERKCAPQSP